MPDSRPQAAARRRALLDTAGTEWKLLVLEKLVYGTGAPGNDGWSAEREYGNFDFIHFLGITSHTCFPALHHSAM